MHFLWQKNTCVVCFLLNTFFIFRNFIRKCSRSVQFDEEEKAVRLIYEIIKNHQCFASVEQIKKVCNLFYILNCNSNVRKTLDHVIVRVDMTLKL